MSGLGLAGAHLLSHVALATGTASPAGIEGAILNFVDLLYSHLGYAGIVLAMALESCCIPLPSEIIMPLAGYYVLRYPNQFSLPGVAIAGAVGCVIGSAVAYGIGAAGGRPLLLKYCKYVLISHADSDCADRWFAKYGAPVAFFSRLLPVVRTYISLPAGIARMNFAQFVTFTLLGSLIWTSLLALLGYNLGNQIVEQVGKLSTIVHGADIVVLGHLLAAVVYYVYCHIKTDRAATRSGRSLEGQGTPQ